MLFVVLAEVIAHLVGMKIELWAMDWSQCCTIIAEIVLWRDVVEVQRDTDIGIWFDRWEVVWQSSCDGLRSDFLGERFFRWQYRGRAVKY